MRRDTWRLVALVLLLAACGPAAPAPTATGVSPTVAATAAPTAAATPTPAPPPSPAAAAPTAIATAPPATRPAATPAATPVGTPVAARTVTFATEDGMTLGGTVYGGGGDWVILSNIGDGLQASWRPLTEALARRGYSVLTYDWRGLGASNAARQDWQLAPRDLAGVIAFARAGGARRLILAGGSLGGIASIKQARAEGVAGIVVVGSPYTVAPLMITPEELGRIAVPKLFVGTKEDKVVPVREVVYLYDNSPQPKTLQLYEGGAHGSAILTSPDRDHFVGLVTDFVAATFAGARASLAAPVQDAAATARWRDDLRAMTEGIRRIHPKPFWRGNEAAFDAAVAQLDRAIPYLDDAAIKVGLSRIAAMIDGHTQLSYMQAGIGFHIYPLRLYAFSDSLFVTFARPPWEGAVGGRLVSIGGVGADEAYRRLAPLAPGDNESYVRFLTPVHLLIAEELVATGVIADAARPEIIVAMPDGRQTTLNPAPVTTDTYRAWGFGFAPLLKQPQPLYLSRKDERFWFTMLDDGQSLYIQYNEVRPTTQSSESLSEMVARIGRALDERPVARVIIDLRHNGGGDNQTYGPLLRLLQSERVNVRGRLFVITGRATFSAATNFATEVERTTAATFVGEPMGGRSNLYGDVRPVTLPNSGLVVQVSAIYWQKSAPDDTRPSIEPALPAPLSSADYFAHRDPALAAILGR